MSNLKHKCKDSTCKGEEAEFIDQFIVGSKGTCKLLECTTCGIMYLIDSNRNFVEDE
jgi:hypothetical protein